jgi:hypothetical protein
MLQKFWDLYFKFSNDSRDWAKILIPAFLMWHKKPPVYPWSKKDDHSSCDNLYPHNYPNDEYRDGGGI